MIVTTGLEPNAATVAHAQRFAAQYTLPLVKRHDESLDQLRSKYAVDEIFVVSAKGVRLDLRDEDAFFFHPNNAAFRIKRLERGDTDTMLSVCQIAPGDRVLDATLGLGADAIVFAYGVGETGRVLGIESQPVVAMLVADGLKSWQTNSPSLKQAMERVEVVAGHHLDVLREQPDHSFDVVYFDPMFANTEQASTGIQGIRKYANYDALTQEAVTEALRVAKRRVVLKEGKGSQAFQRLGFIPYRTNQHQVVYSYRDKIGGE